MFAFWGIRIIYARVELERRGINGPAVIVADNYHRDDEHSCLVVYGFPSTDSASSYARARVDDILRILQPQSIPHKTCARPGSCSGRISVSCVPHLSTMAILEASSDRSSWNCQRAMRGRIGKWRRHTTSENSAYRSTIWRNRTFNLGRSKISLGNPCHQEVLGREPSGSQTCMNRRHFECPFAWRRVSVIH